MHAQTHDSGLDRAPRGGSHSLGFSAAVIAVVLTFGLIGALQFRLAEMRNSPGAWIVFGAAGVLMLAILWSSHRAAKRQRSDSET